MKALLAVAAIAEAATGLALLVYPAIVIRLLFGTEIAGAGVVVSRVAGIAMIALGMACWPGKEATPPALFAMLTYNLLVTLYLLYLGIRGESVGLLLWPVVAFHALMTLLLAGASFKARQELLP